MDYQKDDTRIKRFSLRARLNSFRNAFAGIIRLISHEHNFRIHLAVLILVVITGVVLKISTAEWIAVAVVSGLVLTAESFNTSVELLADRITKDNDAEIKKAKDIAAAGVLVSAIIAAITGLLIFVPRILHIFR